MTRALRRIAPVAALALLAGCELGGAIAATNTNPDTIRCGNKGPYYGRTDGLCLDAETYAPGVVVNGTFDSMLSSSQFVAVEGEFVGDFTIPDVGSVDGAQGPWVATATNQTTSAVQNPDEDDGAVELLVDNGNEVGDITLYWGDESNIDSDKEPFCIFRVKIQTAPVAADTLSWGLMGAQADTVEAVANNAYFGVAGADLNLDIASDDASTDTDNTDTTVDLVAGTWYEFLISLNSMHGVTVNDPDGASATDVHYFYRTSLGGDWTQLLASTTMTIGADIALQPFVQVEKTSGTSTPDLLVDYIKCYWERS
jgi:hypothetical protein